MGYIGKDALVAEIERRLDDLYDYLPDASKVEKDTITISEACNTGKYTALESFRNYIDTLEVKEVDVEKEIENWIENNQDTAGFYNNVEFAKHFFELGLKVQKGENE